MQANTANEHSDALTPFPAMPAASKSRVRVRLLASVSHDASSQFFDCETSARARAQTGSGSREHSINMTNKLDYSNKCATSRENH